MTDVIDVRSLYLSLLCARSRRQILLVSNDLCMYAHQNGEPSHICICLFIVNVVSTRIASDFI